MPGDWAIAGAGVMGKMAERYSRRTRDARHPYQLQFGRPRFPAAW